MPAGSVEDGESPLEAARRELAEELGGSAPAWRHLMTFYSSSAHLSLRSDVFLATGVEADVARPDVDEEVALESPPDTRLHRYHAEVIWPGISKRSSASLALSMCR